MLGPLAAHTRPRPKGTAAGRWHRGRRGAHRGAQGRTGAHRAHQARRGAPGAPGFALALPPRAQPRPAQPRPAPRAPPAAQVQLDEVDALGRNTLHHTLGVRATAPPTDLLPWLLKTGVQVNAAQREGAWQPLQGCAWWPVELLLAWQLAQVC